jgi:hypothetical protein
MAQPVVSRSPGLARRAAFETKRRDAWWAPQLVTFLVFAGFVAYSTWAAFQGAHYRSGPYLSPMYSPEIFGDAQNSWFGGKPGWWPGWIPWSAAFFILWAPGGFRITCYYYRGAYYKAFWGDPPGCTVGEPRKTYRGEASFPLIIQNIHRYFLYLALVFLVFLAHDVWKALWFTDPTTGETSFGIGVGTLVLALNTVLLAGYTFGCHSLRHLVGGRLDEPSKSPARFAAYRCVGCFNRRHMVWAWTSLFAVAFADVYVRLCAMGIWTDWRIL